MLFLNDLLFFECSSLCNPLWANYNHLFILYGMICQLHNSPTNEPTNNHTNWIWMSKKIGLKTMPGQNLFRYISFDFQVLKPYLFAHPNPTIISWIISYTISWQIIPCKTQRWL